MLMTQPFGPRTSTRAWLLTAVWNGAEGFGFRPRAINGYEMHWLFDGTRSEAWGVFEPRFVRGCASALAELEECGLTLKRLMTRTLSRSSSADECGEFDLPVGDEYIANVRYHVRWRNGRVTELEARVRGCAALAGSMIAKCDLDLAWFGYYGSVGE